MPEMLRCKVSCVPEPPVPKFSDGARTRLRACNRSRQLARDAPIVARQSSCRENDVNNSIWMLYSMEELSERAYAQFFGSAAFHLAAARRY